MRKPRARVCALFLVSSFVAASLYEADAAAKSPEGFSVNRFEPAERNTSWFVLASLDLRGSVRPAAGLTLDYEKRPLAIYGSDDVKKEIVSHVFTAHVGANVVLFQRLRL